MLVFIFLVTFICPCSHFKSMIVIKYLYQFQQYFKSSLYTLEKKFKKFNMAGFMDRSVKYGLVMTRTGIENNHLA